MSKSHTAWAEALSNTRVQGSLGEESLKTLLNDAGFVEGVSYEVQKTFKNDKGEQLRKLNDKILALLKSVFDKSFLQICSAISLPLIGSFSFISI